MILDYDRLLNISKKDLKKILPEIPVSTLLTGLTQNPGISLLELIAALNKLPQNIKQTLLQ